MNPNRAIGVDLGGTKILAGVVARDGGVGERRETPTPVGSGEELLEALERAIEPLAGDAEAIGIGVPSIVDRRTGVALGAVNIPLRDAPLRDRFADRFGLPVGIENDANAAALAEWRFGAGRDSRDLIVLTLGTGVGGGVVLDGRLFGGWAELGHIVVDVDGEPCFGTCTGRGHLEAVASGSAADRVAERVYGPGAGAEQLVERAEAGEDEAIAALHDIGRHLGAGIGSLVNVFGAGLVAVGGGFGVAAARFLLPAAEEVARREALDPARPSLRIVVAELGEDAGLVGAGLVAFEALDGER